MMAAVDLELAAVEPLPQPLEDVWVDVPEPDGVGARFREVAFETGFCVAGEMVKQALWDRVMLLVWADVEVR